MTRRRRDPSPSELVSFMRDPASYPHGPDRVRLIQTHISYVAIAPPYAYKVKKPVDFGFLDFSTLEARRRYCEIEIDLNRRLCDGVYERVVPISERGGALRFGTDGAVVEYALEMRALEDGYFLDARIADVGHDEIDRIVAKLGAFYARQPRSAQIARWGRIDRLKVNTDENFRQTEHAIGDLVSSAAHGAIRTFTDGFFDHRALLLNRRRAEGRIVDGHGDLHLEHIHLTPDTLCIFDCIEFNDRFRYLDVANDVAFLAMDMDLHGRRDLARYLVDRMRDALDDPELAELMDFYTCYRAVVRAKVEGMRSEQSEVPDDERSASRRRARSYFRLALQYAITGSDPCVIVLMGRVGTGKTTQADRLAEELGWPCASSDRVRKESAGVPLHVRGSDADRSRLYGRDMTDRTYATLLERALESIRHDRGMILDATYGDRRHRAALRSALAPTGVPCFFVELTGSDETLRDRLRRRSGATDVISDARLEDFDTLSRGYTAPDALEDARHLVFVTDDVPEEQTTLEVLQAIVHLGWER
jgi:uncharacterized protein